MKLLTKLFIIGFTIIFIISSCSIEKRRYMSGYNIEWRSLKPIDTRKTSVSQTATKKYANKKSESDNIQIKNTEIHQLDFSDNSITASTNEQPVIIPRPEQNIRLNETLCKSTAKKSIEFKQNENSQSVSNSLGTFNKKAPNETKVTKHLTAESEGSSGLSAIGWIVLILGILFLLFVSIVLGALLMLLGLVFVISGKSNKETPPSTSEKKSENTNQYVDVVYLKNGGVIKGMIIEQVPNVQVKIQTKDGSIFVHKMDEIEKITKEMVK